MEILKIDVDQQKTSRTSKQRSGETKTPRPWKGSPLTDAAE